MYKLFLCLRYLRRRYIALVAVIGMALCVFMVLVAVSVFNGFLGLVANAARGMMSDVIVDAPSAGLAHYDEFIAELEKIPEIRAATPVIYSYALLQIGPGYRNTVRVVGIRLPQAKAVSTFVDGLYPPELKEHPAFAMPAALRGEALKQRGELEGIIRRREDRIQAIEVMLAEERAKAAPQQDADKVARLEKGLETENADLVRRKSEMYDESLPGVIMGIDIPGTTERDSKTGQYQRFLPLGQNILLTLLPLGEQVTAMSEPRRRTFSLLGDSRMGIYQIDSAHVYVDFDVLQKLIAMNDPPRAHQIQIKVAASADDERHLREVADKVRGAYAALVARFPDLEFARPEIQTWRQKQSQYIGPIEKQRDLVTIMFGIISMVAVVLVFAIFYMMVVQKTKDIGVLKSIGASSRGVAGIYLMYGSAVGLVGSVLGAVAGYWFVRQINPIHDWIANTFGWRMFDRQAYLFDRIPNTVETSVIAYVVVGAILAGLLGALLPAFRAARMQPVEALRYE